MGTGFSKQKKQAKLLREQFGKMQNEMQNTEIVGTAGNGLVTITLTGEHKMKNITIKPECVDAEDIEGLQDLVRAAYNDAFDKLQKKSSSSMPNMPNLGAFGM